MISARLLTGILGGWVAVAGLGCDGASVPISSARVTGCTWPADVWALEPTAWKHRELRMGTTYYAREEQVAILAAEADANGLVALAREMITAHLNLASGMDREGLSSIDRALDAGDALVGTLVVPPRGQGHLPVAETAGTTNVLADFNEGRIGPGRCTGAIARARR